MKKLNLILDSTNWLEATWVEEIITQVEGEEDKVETTQAHCESFSGHKEHIDMLREKAKEFNTPLDEFETLIKKCQDAFVYPDEADTKAEKEKNRILCIKAEAGRVITEKYSDIKQRNILMSGDVDKIKIMNDYIFRIREISNKAEEDGLEYNQIEWGI